MTSLVVGKLYVASIPTDDEFLIDQKHAAGVGGYRSPDFKWHIILPGEIVMWLGKEIAGESHFKGEYSTVLHGENKVHLLDLQDFDKLFALAVPKSIKKYRK